MAKSVSVSHELEETRPNRKSVDLFHFWKEDGPHWRYVNSDVGIVYDGSKYVPAPIARGTVQYNGQLEVSSMSITSNHILRPVIEFVARSPYDIIWVQVTRVFRRTNDASVIFIGHISNTSFQGQKGQVSCVGLEYFLNQEVPIYRYHPACNNVLRDEKCSLAASVGRVQNVSVHAVASDGMSVDFSGDPIATLHASDPDYFVLGYLDLGTIQIMITSQTFSDPITTLGLRYRVYDLAAGDTVDIYNGCDLKAETCRDKFSNLDNFFGFLHVPVDNPVMRT